MPAPRRKAVAARAGFARVQLRPSTTRSPLLVEALKALPRDVDRATWVLALCERALAPPRADTSTDLHALRTCLERELPALRMAIEGRRGAAAHSVLAPAPTVTDASNEPSSPPDDSALVALFSNFQTADGQSL